MRPLSTPSSQTADSGSPGEASHSPSPAAEVSSIQSLGPPPTLTNQRPPRSGYCTGGRTYTELPSTRLCSPPAESPAGSRKAYLSDGMSPRSPRAQSAETSSRATVRRLTRTPAILASPARRSPLSSSNPRELAPPQTTTRSHSRNSPVLSSTRPAATRTASPGTTRQAVPHLTTPHQTTPNHPPPHPTLPHPTPPHPP